MIGVDFAEGRYIETGFYKNLQTGTAYVGASD